MGKKIIPTSLKEALVALNNSECYIVAGGSDIMLQKKNTAGLLPKFDKDVLFIANLDELHYIKKEKDGIHIGATITLEEILKNDLTPNVLKECLKELASSNIRHFATLPGNVANASPAGDTIVVEMMMDALVKLTSINGSRLVKVEDFVKGVRKTELAKNELIEEIIIPNCVYDTCVWYKVGSRKAESISKVMFAGGYTLKGNKIEKISIALGSVFIKAVRSHEIENEIEQLTLDQLKLRVEEFVDKYSNVIAPIDDQRSTKEYRYEVARNIVRKFLLDLVERR